MLRYTRVLIAPLALLICLLTVHAALAGDAPPQNVLLLIADDYGVDKASLYNLTGTTPPTPNINSMRDHGVQFDNAWSNPICSPTRATMLTGRYGFRTGIGTIVSGTQPGIGLDEFTLPMALDAGSNSSYAHANIGKWHLSTQENGGRNNPNLMGYDHFSGVLQGGIQDYYNWSEVVNGATPQPVTTYATTELVNDSIAWISDQDASDKPWFLWVAFQAPHTPFHLPPADLHSFDTLSGEQADIDAQPGEYYAAMVEALDTEIGRLIDSMSPETRQNTTIIFIGDNGTTRQVIEPPLSRSHSKGSLFDGGIHVPLLISSTLTVQPGRNVDALVNGVDIFATVLDLANIDMASVVSDSVAVDSVSMLPYLTSSSVTSERDFIYSELFGGDTTNGGAAIRDARYKLIRYEAGSDALYDLETDPYELSDLLSGTLNEAEEAAYCGLYQGMIDLLETESGAAVPVLPDQCEVPLAVGLSTGGDSAEIPRWSAALLLLIPALLISRRMLLKSAR